MKKAIKKDKEISAKTIRSILTKNNFKEYLQSFSPKTKVGYINNICRCPIAKFLKSNLSKEKLDLIVDECYIEWMNNSGTLQSMGTVDWVNEFINNVDELDQNTISAKKALEILNIV